MKDNITEFCPRELDNNVVRYRGIRKRPDLHAATVEGGELEYPITGYSAANCEGSPELCQPVRSVPDAIVELRRRRQFARADALERWHRGTDDGGPDAA